MCIVLAPKFRPVLRRQRAACARGAGNARGWKQGRRTLPRTSTHGIREQLPAACARPRRTPSCLDKRFTLGKSLYHKTNFHLKHRDQALFISPLRRGSASRRYRWNITKTLGGSSRLSRNQVLETCPGASCVQKVPRGRKLEAVRGEQGSCAREAGDHHDRRPGTRIWPLGTSQSGARRAGRAL